MPSAARPTGAAVAGRYVHVAGESVLILRQTDDSLRAFYNVCSHRGSRLVRTAPLPDPDQPSATCSTSMSSGVVCPYHAWTYNLDGSLRAARYVQFDSTCPKEGFSLVPVQLDTWGGFIFVNLATTPAQSLHEQIAVPERNLGRYPLKDLRRGAQLIYDVRANWKVIMENYNECYHCGPVHPELCALVPAFRERGGAGLDWDDGIPHRAGAWTFTSSGSSNRAPFPGLAAFTAGDAARVFGRERETEALVNRLRVQPLLAVVGPSGAGKSSFVQAGMIPALPEGWKTITLRPGPAPMVSRTAISRHRTAARASSRLATLAQAMSRTNPTIARSSVSGAEKRSCSIGNPPGAAATPSRVASVAVRNSGLRIAAAASSRMAS